MGLRPVSFVLLAATSFATQAQAPSSTLGPVVVSATRFPDDADKLAYGVSIITSEQIRESGASTINEAIIKLLGVPGRADLWNGGDYTLDLRGFGATADSNQVVIVDGVKLNEGDMGGTRLSGIPIDSVDRIEVIRGSGSVLYGEGATGGVIVVTTKAGRGVARKSRATGSMTLGSHSLADMRGNATLAAGGFSVDAAVSNRESDGYRQNQKSETHATSATAQWQGESFRVGASQAYDRLDAGLPGGLNAQQYSADPSQASSLTNRASIGTHRGSLFAQADLGNWQLGLDYGQREKTLRSFSGSVYAYDIEADNLSLRARHNLDLGGAKNAFIFGVDTAEWEREVFASSNAEQKSRAFYAKDDYTFASGTRLSLGGRAERIEKSSTDFFAVNPEDDTQHAWELGLTQPIFAGASAYGRVGRSYRLPNADEFTWTDPATGLRPQTSRDYEVGARWAGETTRAEVRIYRSNLTDEIGYDPAGTNPFGATGANVNYDPTRRQGVEVEVAGSATKTVGLRAVAAYRQARFEGGAYDGNQVPLSPKASVSLQAGWKPTTAHQLDAFLNWVSTQHPDFDNQCTMPSYTTMDLRYAFRQDAVELAFGVKNLTDRKYYTQAFNCTGGVVNSIYPEDGRNFTATVRVSF